MKALVAAVMVATQGAVHPGEVLLMRADFCLWLVEGYTDLHRPAGADGAPRETVGVDGRIRRPMKSLDDLKAFLGRSL